MNIEITTRADGTLTSEARERIRSALASQLRGGGDFGKLIADHVARELTRKVQEQIRAEQRSTEWSRALRMLRARRQIH